MLGTAGAGRGAATGRMCPMYSKWVKVVAVVLLVILGLWILAVVPNW